MYVVNSREMRAIDHYTIEQIGIPALVLMENAGRAVAEEAAKLAGGDSRRFAILVGKGNNGGDGIVAARHLMEFGNEVKLIYATDPATFEHEAAIQRDIARKLNIPYENYSEGSPPIPWRDYDVIVDALLGTGSRGAPRAAYAKLIDEANGSGLPICSLDIPSGLDPDNGGVHAPCIRASCTVALAFSKRGLEQQPGADYAGRVIVRAIGIPKAAAEQQGVHTFRIEEPLLSDTLGLRNYEQRSSDTNKGSFGHVLVAAGSLAMSGAGLLCAKAALRAGCGLVTWALPESWLPSIVGQLPEIMLRGMSDQGLGDWSRITPQALIELSEKKAALVFGPGVGRFTDDTAWLRELWEGTSCPLVLDADALNMLSGSSSDSGSGGFKAWPKRSSPVILTPHPGEMARLCGKSVKDIQMDRIATARTFAEEHGVTLVLKGAHTVIASPAGDVFINPTGNAGMATGGTGDVLAGITASLLAQGKTAIQAAALGAYLHGAAGDRVADSRAYKASLIASDIIEQL
ncbi:NAD(P)H-hydrate dehydratase [Paenibacillus agricola]|uniref:Bifunctional NAD(P)H-hydrate repair enzyme n=1 Tax=Paenibacillus agricola TaxID=2716264 RepID=A0ABX0JDB5_9BACL|nr:NAD(P)H-hydrate dehydratase [Paenibacillus agricola]NHN34475.1 NAD(P)H-hydrate dehydratase [Paenibacillus agricola]